MLFRSFLQSRVGATAAEDILQTVYLKLVESETSVRKDESLVAWFYTVLRHAMVDFHRRGAARDRAHESFAAETPLSYENELTDNVCQCLTGVMETLRPDHRDVLQAVDLQDQSVAAYAATQGVTPNNMGVRLHRARKAAAKQLAAVCGACAEHRCLDCTCRPARV